MTNTTMIEQHPDLMELRARYDRVAETTPARALEGCTLLGGLYLAISPWIVGFNHLTDITVNNLITGLALSVMALGFAWAYGRTHNVTWVAPLIGVWTIIAPWVIRQSGATIGPIISNVIIGALIVLLGAGMVMLGQKPGMAARR